MENRLLHGRAANDSLLQFVVYLAGLDRNFCRLGGLHYSSSVFFNLVRDYYNAETY